MRVYRFCNVGPGSLVPDAGNVVITAGPTPGPKQTGINRKHTT